MKYTREYQAWIRWLGDVIERETAKPDGEADMRLVNECEAFLCELVTAREGVLLPGSALAARLTEIRARARILPPLPRRVRLPARVGKLAACIVLAVVVGVGGALASLSAITALREDEGSPPTVTETTDSTELVIRDPEVTWEGIRYTSLGETVDYGDIETLLAAQALEIPYPTVLPEGVSITTVAVDVTADPATVTYGFSEPTLTMTVALNTAADAEALAQSGETYMAGGMVSYLSADGNGYRATVIGAGTVATVESLSRETVLTVLDGMAEHTPVRLNGGPIQVYEGYLYFHEMVYRSRSYRVWRRMDLATGKISSPCLLDGCTHDDVACPFFGYMGVNGDFYGDWMLLSGSYYWDLVNMTNTATRQTKTLYNLKTGEIKKLPAVLQDARDDIRVGNSIYMVKKGNNLTYPDGITRTYCKVYEYNIDTAEYRVVYEHNDLITLFYGGNTRVYFYQEEGTGEADHVSFYSFNPETGAVREEPKLSMRHATYIYQNRLYRYEYDFDSEEYVIRVNDALTGESFELARGDVGGTFYLDEDGIYYSKLEDSCPYADMTNRNEAAYEAAYRTAREAGDYATAYSLSQERAQERLRERVEYLLPYSIELWYCDLNGENAVKVCDIPYFGRSMNLMWIEEDVMYTYAILYDRETGEELNRMNSMYQMSIDAMIAVDLKSGEVTVLTPDALK